MNTVLIKGKHLIIHSSNYIFTLSLHRNISAYASAMASTLIISVEQDFIEGFPLYSTGTEQECWKALKVQYSLQSQQPESPSAGLPD